jgi:uncharacterized membrane protein YuzA (DUF378 family)
MMLADPALDTGLIGFTTFTVVGEIQQQLLA